MSVSTTDDSRRAAGNASPA
jgi:hypothetical protein